MTWLHIPPFTSAPGTADSNSPSDPWHGYEPYVTLSGTPTPRPFSWKGWARRAWIKHLSGMTFKPSTAQHGVDEWIFSLPVSPASPSRPQDTDVALTMTDGCGLTLHGSSVVWNPDTSSWKTSQTLFDTDYPTSSMALPRSGSTRNGAVSQRPPLVPLTSANDSGLSPKWHTPCASDGHNKASALKTGKRASPGLHWHARNWPTPRASDGGGRGSDPQRKNNRAGSPTFMQVAKEWGSRQDEATKVGTDGLQRVDLNPFFVAALMGLPTDWLTHSTSAVTDSCRNALQKQSDNL